MKRLWIILVVAGLLMGCGTTATQSEFWDHGTHYKSWSHLKYSWSRHAQPTDADYDMSTAEQWWGMPVDHGTK